MSFYESHALSESTAVSEQAVFLTRLTLHQYTKAVGLLSSDTGVIPSDEQAILLTSLMFIWSKLLQDNLDVALQHLRSGVHILTRHMKTSTYHAVDDSVVRLSIRFTPGLPCTEFRSPTLILMRLWSIPGVTHLPALNLGSFARLGQLWIGSSMRHSAITGKWSSHDLSIEF
jgi:hypothetical protein